MRNRAFATFVCLGGVLSACNPRDDNAADSAAPATAAATDTGMQGMKGMEGMSGMMDLSQMQSHMRLMEATGADSMKAMLPMHRQMVANMISQMNTEMRGMNMKPDSTWQATIDSLRQDLVRMPEMSAGELGTFMPRHGARMMRLMDAHRAMMGSMKK